MPQEIDDIIEGIVNLAAAPKNKSLLRGEVSGLLQANNLRCLQ
jgi:hypothetical protein